MKLRWNKPSAFCHYQCKNQYITDRTEVIHQPETWSRSVWRNACWNMPTFVLQYSELALQVPIICSFVKIDRGLRNGKNNQGASSLPCNPFKRSKKHIWVVTMAPLITRKSKKWTEASDCFQTINQSTFQLLLNSSVLNQWQEIQPQSPTAWPTSVSENADTD